MIAQKRVPVVTTGAKKEEAAHNSSSSIADQSVPSVSWKTQNQSAAASAMSSSAPSSSSATTGAVGGVAGGMGRAHFQKNINVYTIPVASQQLHNPNNHNKPAKFISHYAASSSTVPPTSSFLPTRTPSTSQQAMDGAAQSKRRNNNNSSSWGKNNASKKRFNPPYGSTNTPAAPVQAQQQQQQQSPEQHNSPLQNITQKDGQQVDGGAGGKCRSVASSSESPQLVQSTSGARTSSPMIPADRESPQRRSPPVVMPENQKPPPPPKRQDSSGELEAAAKRSPPPPLPEALIGNKNATVAPPKPPPAVPDLASLSVPPPNHYPNELLKIIRDNMNAKDNTNLWALLNNIAAPMIVKNGTNGTPSFPLISSKGSPTSSASSSSGYAGGCAAEGVDVGLKESVILQAMEQNFLQNNPGYELLANALLSNGGLLPAYLTDSLLAPFAPPPGIALHNGNPSAGDTYAAKVAPVVESGGVGNYQLGSNSTAQHQSPHHQNPINYARVPPGQSGHYGGSHQQQQRGHHGNAMYNQYPHNNSNGSPNNNFAYNLQPFLYNGHLFYPRPKNYWNFCLSCKKSQFCYQHTNNCNSSASAFHTNGGCGGLPQQQHHYITLPGNYCPPDFYQRSYPHAYYGGHSGYNGGGYYNHHHHHYQGHHRDKRNHNGRRQYNNSNNNKYHGGNKAHQDSASNGSSTPSGSCPPSPKAASPTGAQHPPNNSSATKAVGQSKNVEARKPVDRDRKGSGNSSGGSIKSTLQQSGGGGRKRWNSRPNVGTGYESDTSSSNRSTGAAEVSKCNYGLLQNMKLWHTDSVYKREPHMLAGELGPQQVMSPTNHRFAAMSPMLITVLEAQNGVRRAGDEGNPLTTTQPVIHQDEPDSESAYWSSVFPFSGGLDEGLESVEESTPADKYLANAHLVELLETPKELIEGPGNRDTLSQQVWNTFLTVQQTQATYRKKLVIWKLLFACIKKVFPRLSVFLVGSTITGFGAETSDVDMCVVSSAESDLEPRLEAVVNLTDLKKLLSMSAAFEQFHLIQAKVPILRFRDTANHIEVDLNYNNSVGIRNTHLMYCYSQLDWRVRPLVLVVKLWAKYHDINTAKNMTISSYSLALMVIHYLQCGVSPAVLPCLHTMYPGKFQPTGDVGNIDMNEELDPFHSDNKQTLGDLLLGFLHYYSHFDYNNLAISVRTGSCLYIEECRYVRSPKNDQQQWKNLCIEEPFDYTNTARSVYDVEVFQKIKYVFVQSYQQLQQTLDLKSVLNEKFISFPVHQYGYVQGQYHQHNHHQHSRDYNDNSCATAVSSP